MTETINSQRKGACLIVTLARPEKHNAIHTQMLHELDAVLAANENDKTIRALLLNAKGRHFSSGIDLGEYGPSDLLSHVFHRLDVFPVPTLAEMKGVALAGGLELALHCDLRLACDSAKLGMTPAKVGLVAPYHFVRKLIEVVGVSNTSRLLFTSDILDARASLAMGMVNEVVEDAKLEEASLAWAERIAANAPLSLRAMKAAMRRQVSTAFDAPHDDIDALMKAVLASQDAKEGPRAFLEKRQPVWKAE